MREIEKLHLWYEENKRPFPWREERTPYRVWISEMMLQQTRASVVIPYFLHWMELFPDVETLAKAPLETVIKTWEGLGYYSRARYLHEGAKQIVEQFGGKIPDSREALSTISGLGSYTVGALLSFGFGKKVPAVDGNVARVLSRYFAIEENISKAKVRRTIEEKAALFLDDQEPWITAEALIELGASVCLRKPRCIECPLRDGCQALSKGIAESLPIKNIPVPITILRRAVAVVESQGRFLVQKGEVGKVMADLYEFPYFEMEGHTWTPREMEIETMRQLGFKVEWVKTLEETSHTFTRFKAHLLPFLLKTEGRELGGTWVEKENLLQLPFSSGHRKIAGRIILHADSFLNFCGHHSGPSLNDRSSPILRQYGPSCDCSNPDHSEAAKIQESTREQYI